MREDGERGTEHHGGSRPSTTAAVFLLKRGLCYINGVIVKGGGGGVSSLLPHFYKEGKKVQAAVRQTGRGGIQLPCNREYAGG